MTHNNFSATTDFNSALARKRAAAQAIGERLSPATTKAYAAIREQASRSIRTVIKVRARNYQREPWQLKTIDLDLDGLPPRHLVAALSYLARNGHPQRWVGFGGEVEAINLRGALLYARLARAQDHRNANR